MVKIVTLKQLRQSRRKDPRARICFRTFPPSPEAWIFFAAEDCLVGRLRARSRQPRISRDLEYMILNISEHSLLCEEN